MWIPEKVMLGGMGVVFLMSLVFLLLQRPQRQLTCLVPGVEGDFVSLFGFFRRGKVFESTLSALTSCSSQGLIWTFGSGTNG